MGFPPPPTIITDQLTYTTTEPATVAVQPGTLRVNGDRTITRQRIQFTTGQGPGAGGTFVGRWLRNGVTMGSITVAASNDDGDIAPPAVPTLADGDLLQFEVVSNAGAAPGAAVGILDI